VSEWRPAPEVAAIAATLLREHHPRLDQPGVRIHCVYRRKATTNAGRTILGRAIKISGIPALLAESQPDLDYQKRPGVFVMEIAEDEWDALTPAQRVALVDHELTHMAVSEEDPLKLTIVGHDVEEFAAVVERHGLWKDDLVAFGEAIKVHDAGSADP
jgi:predicted metallopeptidase